MKAGYNYVLFTVENNDVFNKATGFCGDRGLEIVGDPSWEPSKWVKTWGIVRQLPVALTKKNLMFGSKHLGFPPYDRLDTCMPIWKTLDMVEEDIRVGDKIYFSYNILIKAEENLVDVNLEVDKNGNLVEAPIFKVRYDQIQCIVRGKKIIMVATHILVEPDMETWEDILHPVYYDPATTGGKKVAKPKDKWIQLKVQPEAKYLQGWVRHIGKPLKGSKCVLKKGDKIIYRPNADWKVEIEGKDYYVMHQEHVEAVI